jgi:hypothetical protein
MRLVRVVAANVVGLFVTDWTQTAGIVLILAAGYLAVRVLHLPAVGWVLVALLGLHLVYTTQAEARKLRARSSPGRDRTV